jgi:hypothetical protein
VGKVLAVSASLVKVPFEFVVATVDELRAASTTERMVLWLGHRDAAGATVREVFVPQQQAESDYFHVPPAGMQELLQKLRTHRWMVAAQVHTHPEEAFHSWADDRWAIVRHVGALSLVVPRFCQETTADTFVRDALVFRLTRDNKFVQGDPLEAYEVTP